MTVSTAGRAPGVLIQFADPPPAVQPVQVDVPAFVCVCQRGPLDTPVRVGSWAAFVVTFGDFIGNGLGAYAVKAFFDQGGRVCWIVRVAAAVIHATPTGIQPADRLSSVVTDATGLVVGAAATVRQGSEVHSYLITAVDPATGTVTWDRPLHPAIDIALGFDIAVGAGWSSVTLPAGGGDAVGLTASGPGIWGDRLTVVVTPGRRAATANRSSEPSDGTATPVESTDGFVAGSTVRITQDLGGPLTVVNAVVDHIDQPGRVLWWTVPLPVPPIVPTQPMRLETETFTLSVLEAGTPGETWPDLSMLPAHPRYVATVLAASTLIGAVDVLSAESPLPGSYRLAGGRDGTAGLQISDILGDEALGDGRGVAALHDVDEPAAVAVPDLVAARTPARVLMPQTEPHDPCAPCPSPPSAPLALEATITEAGPHFDTETIVAAQQALIESCEANTERIALLDPPAGDGPMAPSGMRDWAARFASSYAVATVPWLTVIDPLATAVGVRRVPPCGHVAGIMAQTDAESGPWLAAANRTLQWAHGADTAVTEAQHALLNDAGVNVIRALPGRGLVPMGARTLSADTLWIFAPVRRAMIFLRRTLRHSMAWVVFEPNGPALNAMLTTAIGTLLLDVFESGGLAGDSPDQAFYLNIDQSAAAAGELLIDIGVALTKPAEFVTVRVSRTENTLQLTEIPVRVEAGQS